MEHKQLAASSKGHNAPPQRVDHPYRDYLTIPLDELPNISNTPSNFPSKLHHILSRPEFHHVSSLHYMTSQCFVQQCVTRLLPISQQSHAFILFVSYDNTQIISWMVRHWTFVFISFIVLNCTITSIDYAIFYIILSPIVNHYLILSPMAGHGRCTTRTYFPKYFVQLSTTLSLVSLMDGASNVFVRLEMTTMPITTSASYMACPRWWHWWLGCRPIRERKCHMNMWEGNLTFMRLTKNTTICLLLRR